MSLSTKNTRPITIDGLLNEIHLGHLDLNTYTVHGVNTDGTLATIREPSTKKVRGRPVPGRLHSYTITDVPSAAGSFSVLQGTNPWIIGFPSGASLLVTKNGTQFYTALNDLILKSLVITTVAGGSNRTPFVAPGGVTHNPVSSKSIVPSATTTDALDREVAVPSAATVGFDNGAAGDTWWATFVRLN